MADAQAFFEEQVPGALLERLLAALPRGVTVVFHIEGDNGGDWELSNNRLRSSIGPVTEGPKDCELWSSVDDFMAIVQNKMNAKRAFLTGRLRISGDVGLALRLQGALASAA